MPEPGELRVCRFVKGWSVGGSQWDYEPDQWVPISESAMADLEELRARVTEIRHEADRELARHRHNEAVRQNTIAGAREALADWQADWTDDPPSHNRYGWWRYQSANTIAIVTEMWSQIEALTQELAETESMLHAEWDRTTR